MEEQAQIPQQQDSKEVQLLKMALAQISEILPKNEQSMAMLTQNQQQVRDQRIALLANQKMLQELIEKFSTPVKNVVSK